ncbi:FtsX-like permease family protein [Nonomuraea antimicrobica]
MAASRLPEILTQLATASLVTRSTMLIPVLQLLLLAAYALTLTARLLADHRRMEVALLRSRGAGTVRLAALAAGEALLVALPCAVVAPLLGPPLLALVHRLPWIRASGCASRRRPISARSSCRSAWRWPRPCCWRCRAWRARGVRTWRSSRRAAAACEGWSSGRARTWRCSRWPRWRSGSCSATAPRSP